MFVSICRVCILKSRTDLKDGDLGVISKPLLHSRLYLSPPLDSPLPPPLPPVNSASFGLRWLRLKANEATNVWKDRNLLCFKFAHQPSPHLAQQCVRGKDVRRSRLALHDGLLHAPFLTNNPPATRLPSLPFPSLFWARARGQVHLQGAWIEMHWSFAHWKQAYSLFFLCIKNPLQCTFSFQERACFQGLFSKRCFYKFLEKHAFGCTLRFYKKRQIIKSNEEFSQIWHLQNKKRAQSFVSTTESRLYLIRLESPAVCHKCQCSDPKRVSTAEFFSI